MSESDAGVQSSVREIADARQQAAEYLAQARADEGVRPSDVAYSGSAIAKVHAAVTRFYDAVRPYRSGAEEIWSGEKYDRAIGQLEYRDQGEHHQRVLESLDEYQYFRNVEVTHQQAAETNRRGESQDVEQVRKRLYLPVALNQIVFDRLCDAVVDANLGADLPDEAKTAYGDYSDVLKNGEEWLDLDNE